MYGFLNFWTGVRLPYLEGCIPWKIQKFRKSYTISPSLYGRKPLGENLNPCTNFWISEQRYTFLIWKDFTRTSVDSEGMPDGKERLLRGVYASRPTKQKNRRHKLSKLRNTVKYSSVSRSSEIVGDAAEIVPRYSEPRKGSERGKIRRKNRRGRKLIPRVCFRFAV